MEHENIGFAVTEHVGIGRNYPLTVIAGPCVIESEELCLQTADEMSRICEELGLGYIFKASFDKANRSRIDSFRGPGLASGLNILNRVRHKHHVPVLTDIHEPEQVHEVAAVADVLQVPAFLCRQTDLLIAAGQSGVPVNVKKGQFCAPEDMRGAVEKIASTGNRRILLTERGTFFGYHNLVVDMRSFGVMRELGVPVVFDATHSVQLPGSQGHASGGQREFTACLARAAAAAGIDALFLEVHPSPEEALSDATTSVSPGEARDILKEVKKIHESA